MKSILIVDDSAELRTITRRFLEAQPGFEVCGEAADGIECLAKAQELEPDLILLDFSMPRMNGLETAQVLQAMLPLIPKILFTAHKNTVPVDFASSAGISAVLYKGDGLDALMAEIQRLAEPLKYEFGQKVG